MLSIQSLRFSSSTLRGLYHDSDRSSKRFSIWGLIDSTKTSELFPETFKCWSFVCFSRFSILPNKFLLRSRLIRGSSNISKSIAKMPLCGSDKCVMCLNDLEFPRAWQPYFSSSKSWIRYRSDGRKSVCAVSALIIPGLIFCFFGLPKQEQQFLASFCSSRSWFPVTNIMAFTFSSKLDWWPSRYKRPLCVSLPRRLRQWYITV